MEGHAMGLIRAFQIVLAMTRGFKKFNAFQPISKHFQIETSHHEPSGVLSDFNVINVFLYTVQLVYII